MNIAVAAIERGDKRAMPQTPCPDVQLLLSRVPKPTKSPATARRAKDHAFHRGNTAKTMTKDDQPGKMDDR
jgi:hypothetical protein